MPCTKTGAQIYLATHDEFLYGDAFELNGVAYFNLATRGFSADHGSQIHYAVYDYDTWLNQGLENSIIHGSLLVTADYKSLGYTGMGLNEFLTDRKLRFRAS